MLSTLVAIAAPIINCIQLVPQLYKTYTTRRVADLSPYSLLLILVTNLLWFAHGAMIRDVALLVSGSVSLLVNGALLFLYGIYS
jgi:MtN3 and saliva related transmembrane protein